MSQTSAGDEEPRTTSDKFDKTGLFNGDSDLEVNPCFYISFAIFCSWYFWLLYFLQIETEVPALESFVSWEVIRHLKPKEKKRQEVINGNLADDSTF